MNFPVSLIRCVLVALAAAVLGGCLDSARSQLDEEKEPHFLTGKSRVSSMDYAGAIEAFEKALEVNPQSASAHFELAWLYEQKEGDPAAAIYHYQKYLKLRPNAENGDLAKQHIVSCKQALASTVSLGPITEKQQRDFEKMVEENKRLTDENRRLNDALTSLRGTYGARPAGTGSVALPAEAAARQSSATPVGPTILVADLTARTGNTSRAAGALPAGARTHTVKAGETLAQIAKQYGVRLEALQAANPKIEPRRLRVGQALAIPGP